MDSPITISSSPVDSFDSHKDRKCALEDPKKNPKYWNPKYIRSDSSSTLCQIQKVKDWIESIDEVDGKRREPPEPSGLILMHYNYGKPCPSKTKYETTNPFNRSSSLIDYIKEKSNINDTLAYLTNGRSETPPHKEDSEDDSEFFKLHESKKRELCSYLKLMDPADKKEIFILPNRRSTRVRNLEAMQKQKQLDKEIVDEKDVKSGSNQDMEESEGNSFHFPFPPRKFTLKVDDFDAAMSRVMPQFRSVKTDRKCVKRLSIKNKENVARSKVFVKNKENLRNDTVTNKKLKTKRNTRTELARAAKTDKRNNNIRKEIVPVLKYRLRRFKHRLRQSKFHKHNNIKKKKPPPKPKPETPTRKKQSPEVPKQQSEIPPLQDPTINSPTTIIKPLSNSRCEIITISPNSEYGNNHSDFMDDISDYELFSEEHKRSLIETRIFSTKPEVIPNEPLLQNNINETRCIQDLKTNDHKSESCTVQSSETSSTTSRKRNSCLEVCPRSVKKSVCDIQPFDKNVEQKSLQKSLQFVRRRHVNVIDSGLSHHWEAKVKKQSHYIRIDDENGDVLRAFYVDYNLVVCQEFAVSFWMQTALGNILGSQNMWIPLGCTQRIVLNNKCIQRDSKEMVLSIESNVAYIELWTKEHESDKREGPVADIFVTIYFWKQRQSGLDKKVLQLENINGFADHVQYCVVKNSPKVIVSWHSANGDGSPSKKTTFIRAYELASDYQTISNIHIIQPVKHYIASLHNIEDCDDLIIGCGDNKITLWNLEHGYVISTIELNGIKTSLSTLWVKCDRGFLFAIQKSLDEELRLIAINSINHSWKKLASYTPSDSFKNLKGVCMENGVLLSYYDQGILCWTAETGEPIEEIFIETNLIPSGSYVISLDGDMICVKHATTHLLCISTDDV